MRRAAGTTKRPLPPNFAGVVRFGQCPKHEILMYAEFLDTNGFSSLGDRRPRILPSQWSSLEC